MDEIYQNTQKDDAIDCNVVINQLNFLNSIVYRDKVDFNNSILDDKFQQERKILKAKSTLYQKNCQVPAATLTQEEEQKVSSSSSGNEQMSVMNE